MAGIVNRVREIVKSLCKQAENPFGFDIYSDHILQVVKHAKELARLRDADEEIVELAALLHDVGSIKGDLRTHHLTGTVIAGEILSELGYPPEKADTVKHCVLAHRGSRDVPFESVEAEIVASADGMSHVDSVVSLLRLHMVMFGKSAQEAKRNIREKLKRSWKKVLPEGKERLKEKYEAAMVILA